MMTDSGSTDAVASDYPVCTAIGYRFPIHHFFPFPSTTTQHTLASMYQQPQASAGDAAVGSPVAQQQSPPGTYISQYYPASYTPVPATTTGPIVAPGALSYYAFSGNNIAQADAKPGEMAPSPAEPTVTPKVAENAMRKLVTVELKNVGFEKAEPMAVRQLELEVQACKSDSRYVL